MGRFAMGGRGRQGAPLAIALLVAAGSAWFMWHSLRERPTPSASPDARAQRWGSARSHAELLGKVPAVDVTGEDREAQLEVVASSIAAAVQAPLDAPEELTPEAEEALVATTVGYLDAMTRSSAEAYVALASAESTVWIGPDDEGWTWIDDAIEYAYGRSANRDDPRGELRAVFDYYRGRGSSLASIAVDPRGLGVVVEHGRTASDLNRVLLYERYGPESFAFLTGGGANEIRFRDPATTPSDVLRLHREILFANTAILVITEDDKPGVWHATWYWDPDGHRWLNYASRMESFYVMGTFY